MFVSVCVILCNGSQDFPTHNSGCVKFPLLCVNINFYSHYQSFIEHVQHRVLRNWPILENNYKQ